MRRLALAMLMAVVLAGCGMSKDSAQEPTTTRPAPSAAPAPTTTAQPTTTTAPSPTTPPTTTTAPTTSTAEPTTGTSPTSFSGDWTAHCCSLKIDGAGSFQFSGRTYVFCTAGPPPCDRIVGNEIIDGARASGTIISRSGPSAVARVTSTTDTDFISRGTVQFVYHPAHDTLTIGSGATPLCGPSAPVGYCGM